MAFYSKRINTPKKTSKANAVDTRLRLNAGIIHHVEIMFPGRCAGLAHVQILHGGHPLYPLNPDESFSGDGVTIKFDDYYELGAGDNVLTILTWNDDEGYDHAPHICVGVLPKWVAAPYLILATFADILTSIAARVGIRA